MDARYRATWATVVAAVTSRLASDSTNVIGRVGDRSDDEQDHIVSRNSVGPPSAPCCPSGPTCCNRDRQQPGHPIRRLRGLDARRAEQRAKGLLGDRSRGPAFCRRNHPHWGRPSEPVPWACTRACSVALPTKRIDALPEPLPAESSNETSAGNERGRRPFGAAQGSRSHRQDRTLTACESGSCRRGAMLRPNGLGTPKLPACGPPAGQ